MNNEIKEILDKLKSREETYQFCKQYKLSVNDWIYEAHYLLDYITNLQQENKKISKQHLETINKLIETQQENERLKDDFKNDGIRDVILERDGYLEQLEDYKSRCEKANEKIQYIIDYGFDYDGFNTVESLKGLIDMLVDYAKQSKNILQNGSDEDA